jgi:mannose-6-phosphate isomerase-like protein (cupin superfamily)
MHVIDLADLPTDGLTRELQGDEHGGLPVSLLFADLEPGRGPAWHRHAYAEVFIVLDGEATVDIGDERLVVRGGQVVIAPAGVPHRFTNTGATNLRQIDLHLREHTLTEWLADRPA